MWNNFKNDVMSDTKKVNKYKKGDMFFTWAVIEQYVCIGKYEAINTVTGEIKTFSELQIDGLMSLAELVNTRK